MLGRAVVLLTIIGAIVAVSAIAGPRDAAADHKDNHNHAYLYPNAPDPYAPSQPDADEWEMNARTVSGLTIRVRFVAGSIVWRQAYTVAMASWNSGLSATTGFNVFTDTTTSTTIDFDATAVSGDCFSPTAHGCVRSWNPATPSGTIKMIFAWFVSGPGHKPSDIMHELGHILMTANEHHSNPTNYNCQSIMGHSSPENWAGTQCPAVLMSPQSHDIVDFVTAYSVLDAPNATYATMYGSGTIVHWFEGGYGGGAGKTVHQERYNRITRSTAGLGGSYGYYLDGFRKVSNGDDSNPENDAIGRVPAAGAEWCFKRFGVAYSANAGYEQAGPAAKIYCVARSGGGSGVFVTSNRNGNAEFRVANFSGATITNVQLRTDPPPGTRICYFGDIPNNTVSGTCTSSIGGPGYLTLWYNNAWVAQDTIGFDQ